MSPYIAASEPRPRHAAGYPQTHRWNSGTANLEPAATRIAGTPAPPHDSSSESVMQISSSLAFTSDSTISPNNSIKCVAKSSW